MTVLYSWVILFTERPLIKNSVNLFIETGANRRKKNKNSNSTVRYTFKINIFLWIRPLFARLVLQNIARLLFLSTNFKIPSFRIFFSWLLVLHFQSIVHPSVTWKQNISWNNLNDIIEKFQSHQSAQTNLNF